MELDQNESNRTDV
jgi:hypothetical protein